MSKSQGHFCFCTPGPCLTAGLLVFIQAAQAQSSQVGAKMCLQTAHCSPSEIPWSGVSLQVSPSDRWLQAPGRSLSLPRVQDFLSHITPREATAASLRQAHCQQLRCSPGVLTPGMFHHSPLQLLQEFPHTRPLRPLNCDGPSERSVSQALSAVWEAYTCRPLYIGPPWSRGLKEGACGGGGAKHDRGLRLEC